MTKTTASMILKEHQDCRRGRNEYDWRHCNYPEGVKNFPYTPFQLGMAIDEAIDALEMSIRKNRG